MSILSTVLVRFTGKSGADRKWIPSGASVWRDHISAIRGFRRMLRCWSQERKRLVGLMNTSAQLAGLVGAVAFGYIVEHFHSYDAPFVPRVALLLVGGLSWLKINASDELKPEAEMRPQADFAG